jgi:hypothetical protein
MRNYLPQLAGKRIKNESTNIYFSSLWEREVSPPATMKHFGQGGIRKIFFANIIFQIPLNPLRLNEMFHRIKASPPFLKEEGKIQ